MQEQRDRELADDQLRESCRKSLQSLQEHWAGLVCFVDDPRVPMDNNRSERQVRGPAMGRKNYYGPGSEWSGRLAVMLFSIFATLKLWKLNPQRWLTWFLEACATAGGRAPADISGFLPWNLTPEQRAWLAGPAPQATGPPHSARPATKSISVRRTTLRATIRNSMWRSRRHFGSRPNIHRRSPIFARGPTEPWVQAIRPRHKPPESAAGPENQTRAASGAYERCSP